MKSWNTIIAVAAAVAAIQAQAETLEVQRTDTGNNPQPPPFLTVGELTPEKEEKEEDAFRPLADKKRYDIGELTGDEQAYVELVNRARIDPKAEGRRLVETEDPDVLAAYRAWNVDLDWVLNAPEEGFNHLPVAGVLVPNAALTEAARRQAQDMLDNNFQGHIGSDGSGPGDRAKDAGYGSTFVTENVARYYRIVVSPSASSLSIPPLSVFRGHAGANVDWGEGDRGSRNGIQNPPGHRLNIHDPEHREIGVGVFWRLTRRERWRWEGARAQVFGTRHDITPFVTGVAYYDLNGNRFYDSGEGLGGIWVDVEGSDFYALTHNSGGFGVPVPRNGRYQVTFSGTGFADEIVSAVVARSENTKVDFSPIYQPPPPRITMTRKADGVEIGWEAGTLQRSLLIDGPWKDVESGGAERRIFLRPSRFYEFFRVKPD